MLIFTPSCRLFRTMKIEQLLQFSDNRNSVQSTVTNNKSIQQTVMAQMKRIGTLIYIEK